MQRILVPPGTLHAGDVVIRDPGEVHHCVRVRRVQPGDEVECFDGQGRSGRGRVVRAGAREVVVSVAEVRDGAQPAGGLHVAASLIRPSRFDWMIEKLTELGTARITPLVTERTTIRPGRYEATGRLARWRRLAAEAAKQCGGDTVPVIDAPEAFDTFLKGLPAPARVLIPTLAVDAPPLRTAAAGLAGAGMLTVLIGPEGDFTAGEVAAAQARGAQPVSLGRRTLRSETAAIAAAAVLQHMAEAG